jgi:hypothetical protein
LTSEKGHVLLFFVDCFIAMQIKLIALVVKFSWLNILEEKKLHIVRANKDHGVNYTYIHSG